ncbi:unnamed protein product, partial [Staurois parvus]
PPPSSPSPPTTPHQSHPHPASQSPGCHSRLQSVLPTPCPISILNSAARLLHLTNRFVSSTPPLASTQCPPPPSANPSTGLHSVSSTPLCHSLHWPLISVLHTPLCQSLHWPPLQCPPPLSAN